MIGVLVFGFFIGLVFSAYYRSDSMRDFVWNIIFAMIASIQGKLLMSLAIVDGLQIPAQLVLIGWVISLLFLKKFLLSPKPIKYLH